MATSLLLGPPEIYAQSSSTTTVDQEGDTDMGTAQTKLQNLTISNGPHRRLGFTENNSLTYVATGNPCLDFFFHVVPSTPSDEIVERAQKAWAHEPLTTLKLICNLRGVRGTGKSDKERFYTTALWLHKLHPKTLALNARVFAEFGYFKDLLEILYRVLVGETVRQSERSEWKERKASKGKGRMRKMHFLSKKSHHDKTEKKKEKNTEPRLPRDVRVKQNIAMAKVQREHAKELKKERNLTKARKAYERYNRDPVFRFLHDCVSDMFAETLKSDIQALNAGQLNKISLAAKWCPTIDSSYDKSLLICESIARRVFPRDSDPEYQGIEEAHYAYRVRDRLRKQLLVPLHKALQLPEVYMSAKEWESLPYNRVASVAMKNYKEHFLKHDNKRFHEYLDNVTRGKATIAAGALLPHEIVASLGDSDGGEVAELQWKRMVDDVAKEGKLNNCIAVCDVSGSMHGEPMEVCVALGLMVSELSEEPWKGKVITFHEKPKLHRIEGGSLVEKTKFIRKMEWGGNTDFQKVFDQILNVAVQGNLREDQMIKRVIVFSDMEFDQASGRHHTYYGGYSSGESSDESEVETEMAMEWNEEKYEARLRKMKEKENTLRKEGWKTDYEVIQSKFKDNGFNKVPEIVFWNLRNSRATPVPSDQVGVALVSGFSKNLLKLFLENGGIINPELAMEKAISTELYQKLIVYD